MREKQIQYQKKYVGKKKKPNCFQVGDKIIQRCFKNDAFGLAWEGPYEVLEVLSESIYKIRRNDSDVKVHIDDLRLLPEKQPLSYEMSNLDSEEEDDYNEDDNGQLSNNEFNMEYFPDNDKFHDQEGHLGNEIEEFLLSLDEFEEDRHSENDGSYVPNLISSVPDSNQTQPQTRPNKTRTCKPPAYLQDYICD
ncbi:unnamed protein product [Ceutorhynchus assimilis]|uniref:Uncharacterized protein n=1 Tax=Ceutorhynchus assimilis TaxID=467358 RepID=A0A9N9MNS8_9CUCU|nr:unnamed protein product [Ceutorhynchus assimilis]